MSKPIPELYDPSLLKGSDEDRLAYFGEKTVAHPHLTSARHLAQDNIEFGAKHELVAIIGPSEVGATTLCHSLHKYYGKEWPTLQNMSDAQSMACSLAVSAPSSLTRIDENYWKRFLKDLLLKGGDLLIDRKLYVPPSEFQLLQYTPYSYLGKQDFDALMSSVRSMFLRRKTKVVLIDQAERLFPQNDKAGCIRSQQILTDLARQSETRIVLIANYRLLQTTGTGGDWLQRRSIVHLRRYDRNNEEELATFNSVLVELLGHIPGPLRLTKLSVDGATDMYVNSLGCIGSLKNTLTMAANHSFRTGVKMTEDFIRQFFQPNVAAANLARQAKLGERLLTDIDPKEIERILDPNWIPEAVDPERTMSGAAGATKTSPKRSLPSFGRRIGERRPTRDPVGGVNAKRA